MKTLDWIFILIGLLAYSSSGQANTTLNVAFGPSLNSGDTNPKAGQLGVEFHFNTSSLAVACAGIFESPLNGECDVIFSARITTKDGMFIRLGAGPAYFFRTDDRVSSNWNATIEAAIGFTQDGWSAGVKEKHGSNAGFVPPNFGRDWLLAFIEFGL
jgi:hypothetical protein